MHADDQNIAARVLETIRAKNITPRPAWHFLVGEWVVRSVAFVALIAGSFCTALIFYIVNTSWPLRAELMRAPFASVVSLVPVIWAALHVVAIAYAVHAVHRTRRGYRYNSSWLVLGALGVSIACGALIYASGMGRALDSYLLSRAPAYGPLSGHFPERYVRPLVGMRAGVIEAGPEGYVLRDSTGSTTVLLFREEDTRPVPEGSPVRVFGTTTDTGLFLVEELRPMRGMGMQGGMHQGRGMHLRGPR